VPVSGLSGHADFPFKFVFVHVYQVAEAFKQDIDMFGYDFDGIAGEVKLPPRAAS